MAEAWSFSRGVESSSVSGLPKFTLSLVEIDMLAISAVLSMCVQRSTTGDEEEEEEEEGGRVIGSVMTGRDAMVVVGSSTRKCFCGEQSGVAKGEFA